MGGLGSGEAAAGGGLGDVSTTRGGGGGDGRGDGTAHTHTYTHTHTHTHTQRVHEFPWQTCWRYTHVHIHTHMHACRVCLQRTWRARGQDIGQVCSVALHVAWWCKLAHDYPTEGKLGVGESATASATAYTRSADPHNLKTGHTHRHVHTHTHTRAMGGDCLSEEAEHCTQAVRGEQAAAWPDMQQSVCICEFREVKGSRVSVCLSVCLCVCVCVCVYPHLCKLDHRHDVV